MLREWYFQAMGQEIGPLSGSELKAKVANGQIQPDTLIRKGTEGKWIFGMNIKGLFAVPPEPPAAPIAPHAPVKPKSSATIPVSSSSKTGSNPILAVNPGSKPSSSPVIPATYMTLHEEETESRPPSVEFYDFVGFREAISPVLHDAVKQFASDRGITISQLNRRALAGFIQRPELASDLVIMSVAALSHHTHEKSHRDVRHLSSDHRHRADSATFRFTLFNTSQNSIHVDEGAFLPESVEVQSHDANGAEQHPTIDHAGHIPVPLDPVMDSKPVRLTLDVTVPPKATQEIFVWFQNHGQPGAIKTRGQLLVGQGNGLAMSEYFTIIADKNGA